MKTLLGNLLLKHHHSFFVRFYLLHQENRTSYVIFLPLLQHRALCLSTEHEHSAHISLFLLGHPATRMCVKHMDCFTSYE